MLQVRLRVDALLPVVVFAHVEPVQVRRGSAARVAERALERVLERFPEVPVEVRVNQRIQRGVKVPDPENDSNHRVRVVARAAQAGDDVPQEEGQPAEDEGAHDDPQGPRGLVLPLHLADVALLGRCVVVVDVVRG